MKICHLTSVHSQTDTRIFLKECISLKQAGFEVNYVVPGVENSVVEGVVIHGVEKGNGNRFERMTKTVKRVYKKAIDINADVYHFHDPELIPIGIILKRKGKKVIYDIHEDLPRAILSKPWIPLLVRKIVSKSMEIIEDYSVKKFDYLMTATPFITERFFKFNSNTVNINNYPLLNELNDTSRNSNNKERKVCYIGGLVPIRGMHQLLETANMVEGKMVFAGPMNPKEMIQKFNSHENIEYVGLLDRKEVKNLLNTSVAGIVTFLPEPNNINAQPNKMFEYMSAGIPVICSDFPLWRSIIEKYNCGVCVDPEKPKEIANAINHLLINTEVAETMGARGRKAIEEEFNWEQESKKLIAIYEALAER